MSSKKRQEAAGEKVRTSRGPSGEAPTVADAVQTACDVVREHWVPGLTRPVDECVAFNGQGAYFTWRLSFGVEASINLSFDIDDVQLGTLAPRLRLNHGAGERRISTMNVTIALLRRLTDLASLIDMRLAEMGPFVVQGEK